MDLVSELMRVTGSKQTPLSLLESTAADIGVRADSTNRALIALALCKAGRRPEEVSANLSWKEFETFCTELFKASGFEVRENVILTKPRAQVDMVAYGRSYVLSVDCKHWKRSHSPSVLTRFAKAQLRRSALLRRRLGDAKPIVSAILTFSEPAGTFVEGVAVVPVRTLRSFLDSLETYSELLSFR